MEILTTGTFDSLFKAIPAGVQAKAIKKTDLFKENPFHPSLRIEKLHPKNFNVWSFRIDLQYPVKSIASLLLE
jgi:toxin HigB-1